MYTYVITQRGYNEELTAPYLVLNVWIVKAKTPQMAHNMIEPYLDTFPHPEDEKMNTICIDDNFMSLDEEHIVWSSRSLT